MEIPHLVAAELHGGRWRQSEEGMKRWRKTVRYLKEEGEPGVRIDLWGDH